MKNTKNKKITESINRLFSENKDKTGSVQRLMFLLNNYPQKGKNCINYLVAGSWAIEIISKEKLAHDDLDIICLDDIPCYVDDAETKEESCNGPIPLERNFLLSACVEKCSFRGKEVYVDGLDLQLALKLIGELDKNLSERAMKQLHVLLNIYKRRNYAGDKKIFIYIFKKLLPRIICFESLADELEKIIKQHSEEKNVDKNIASIHSIINGALHTEFLKL